METNWSKVFEVFGSGIVGVFLVMFLLQVLTQLSTRVIDVVENLGKGKESTPGPKTPAATMKD
jgi:hypothetical protein